MTALLHKPVDIIHPRATTALPMIGQRTGLSRRLNPVTVEVAKRRKFDVVAVAERAFFPRYFWQIVVGMSDPDDPQSSRILARFVEDIQDYADLMLPGQCRDFEREMTGAAMAAMAPALDKSIGTGGGWHSIKVLVIGFALAEWADIHATGPIFTTRFAETVGEIADHIAALHGDEWLAVAPSAEKALPKVIARLKACGLFGWLPDYRIIGSAES
ncbi:MAG: hypothetical protein ABID63_18405 [Pseudomonadota bacterium]